MSRFVSWVQGLFITAGVVLPVSGWADSSTNLCRISRGPGGASPCEINFLKRHYTRPKSNESNYYFDLWTSPPIVEITRAVGLTHNRALFINSHAKAVRTPSGLRHAFYPHQKLLRKDQKRPYFFLEDFVKAMGTDAAKNIHNVLIAGCNEEGTFSSREVRQHFPNATNIIHMAGGDLGYQAMFVQALTTPSAHIRPLYEIPRTNHLGKVEYVKDTLPLQNATRLPPYIADVFRPGESRPYRIQIAGRELLDPQMRK